MEILKDKQEPLQLHFERARDALAEMNGSPAGAAGPWHEDRLQVRVCKFSVADTSHSSLFEVIRSLSSISRELALAVPATIAGVTDFNAAKLDWARSSCRWFPGVSDI
jgi:hypothetical protein